MRTGCPGQVTYFPGNAKWEKTWRGRTIRCTAFVPPDLDARILLLEAGGEGRVLYRREGEAERSWSIRDRLCLADWAGGDGAYRLYPGRPALPGDGGLLAGKDGGVVV